MKPDNFCGYCDGTGQCAECHGTGLDTQDPEYPQCIECRGGGKCHECRGTGRAESWARYLWTSFDSLDHTQQRWIVSGIIGAVAGTILFGQVMVPMLVLAAGVAIYMRLSAPKKTSIL